MSFRKRIRNGAGVALIGLAAALVTGILSVRIPIISQMEFHALDTLMRNRPPEEGIKAKDLPLVILQSGKEEMRGFRACDSPGCSHVPRDFTVKVLQEIRRLRPSVIAFDIYLDEPRPECREQNKRLVRAIKALPQDTHVVFAGEIGAEGQTLLRPPENVLPHEVAVAWPLVSRPYNRCRTVGLIKMDSLQGPIPTFALSVFLHWKRMEQKEVDALSPALTVIGTTKIPTLESEAIPLSPFPAMDMPGFVSVEGTGIGPGAHLMLINWSGPTTGFRYCGLEGLGRLPEGTFKGQVVLVGMPGEDKIPTPIGSLRGFEVQANAIATLISGRPLTPVASMRGFLWTWAIASLVIFTTRRGGAFSGLGTLVALGGANLLGAVFLLRHNIWLYTVLPFLGGVVAYTFAVSLEQERVKKMLLAFIPAPIRRQESGAFEEATVLVADIRRFSDVSERVDSNTIFRLINEYYSVVEAVLDSYGGTLVQSEGDKIVAFFAEERRKSDHARDAVRAAIALLQRLQVLNKTWPDPAFRIGVGISTGPCTVGILGRQHRDATLLGNTVNVAAHLESLTRPHNCPVILSEETCSHLEGVVPVEMLGVTTLKWSDRQIAYYRVAGLQDPAIEKGMYCHEPSLKAE